MQNPQADAAAQLQAVEGQLEADAELYQTQRGQLSVQNLPGVAGREWGRAYCVVTVEKQQVRSEPVEVLPHDKLRSPAAPADTKDWAWGSPAPLRHSADARGHSGAPTFAAEWNFHTDFDITGRTATGREPDVFISVWAAVVVAGDEDSDDDRPTQPSPRTSDRNGAFGRANSSTSAVSSDPSTTDDSDEDSGASQPFSRSSSAHSLPFALELNGPPSEGRGDSAEGSGEAPVSHRPVSGPSRPHPQASSAQMSPGASAQRSPAGGAAAGGLRLTTKLIGTLRLPLAALLNDSAPAPRTSVEFPLVRPQALHASTASLSGGSGTEPRLVVGLAYRPAHPKKNRVTEADFEKLRLIGRGSFGKVLQVKKKDSGRIYAMKVLRKDHVVKNNAVIHTMAENRVLKMVDHPFIVNLKYAFQTATHLYMVIDFLNGGELFYHLTNEDYFPEERCRFYAAEVASALSYLHLRKILYRDLKPENVLLDWEGHIALVDFGLCKEGLGVGAKTTTFCGSPEYLAPELLAGRGYGTEVDWWALGTFIFEMLTGLPPFWDEDEEQMQRKILSAPLKFPPFFSTPVKDLLRGLLNRNPQERLGYGVNGSENVKSHPWFRSIDWEKLEQRELTPPFKPHVNGLMDIRYFDKAIVSEIAELGTSVGHGGRLGEGQLDPNMFLGFSFDGESEQAMAMLQRKMRSSANPTPSSASRGWARGARRSSVSSVDSADDPTHSPLHPSRHNLSSERAAYDSSDESSESSSVSESSGPGGPGQGGLHTSLPDHPTIPAFSIRTPLSNSLSFSPAARSGRSPSPSRGAGVRQAAKNPGVPRPPSRPSTPDTPGDGLFSWE